MHVSIRLLLGRFLISVCDSSDIEAVLGDPYAGVEDIVKYKSLLCRAVAVSKSFNVISLELIAHLTDNDPQRPDIVGVLCII